MLTSDRFAMNVPRVIGELIDDEAILIDLETGTYYSLVGSGALVWSGVLQRASIGQLVRAVGDACSGVPADLDAVLLAFLEELLAAELIVGVDGGPSDDELTPIAVPAEANGSAVSAPPFVAPTLDRFDDMQDLILLDPIHDVVEDEGWPRAKPTA